MDWQHASLGQTLHLTARYAHIGSSSQGCEEDWLGHGVSLIVVMDSCPSAFEPSSYQTQRDVSRAQQW